MNSAPILEPILVVRLGCSLGANWAFDPWPDEHTAGLPTLTGRGAGRHVSRGVVCELRFAVLGNRFLGALASIRVVGMYPQSYQGSSWFIITLTMVRMYLIVCMIMVHGLCYYSIFEEVLANPTCQPLRVRWSSGIREAFLGCSTDFSAPTHCEVLLLDSRRCAIGKHVTAKGARHGYLGQYIQSNARSVLDP